MEGNGSPEDIFSHKLEEFIKRDNGLLSPCKRSELVQSVITTVFKAGAEEKMMTKRIKILRSAATMLDATKLLKLDSRVSFEDYKECLGGVTQMLGDGRLEEMFSTFEMLLILFEVERYQALQCFGEQIEGILATLTDIPLDKKFHPAKLMTSILYEIVKTGQRGEEFIAKNIESVIGTGNCLRNFQSFPARETRTIFNILKRVQHSGNFKSRDQRRIKQWAAEFLNVEKFKTVEQHARTLIQVLSNEQ